MITLGVGGREASSEINRVVGGWLDGRTETGFIIKQVGG